MKRRNFIKAAGLAAGYFAAGDKLFGQKFLDDIKPDYVSLSGFCPLPGSPIYKNPELYSIKKIDNDWSKHAHLLYRFSDEEEVGIPFEYKENATWGKAFTRNEIKDNIIQTQRWLESKKMVY